MGLKKFVAVVIDLCLTLAGCSPPNSIDYQKSEYMLTNGETQSCAFHK
jgi:hypothetical protein